MGTDAPTVPEQVPSFLAEHLDELSVPELRAVRTYVDKRIEYCRTPLADRIHAEAVGEVLDIADCGAYTLVRMRIPDQESPNEEGQNIGLYRVRREKRLNGEEDLNWLFLGDYRYLPGVVCENCGESLDTHTQTCPRCGNEIADTSH